MPGRGHQHELEKGLIKTKSKSVCVAAFAGSLIALSACSSNGRQDTEEFLSPTDSQIDARQTEIPVTSISLNDQIALSRQDLARRLGKNVNSITVVAARQVTWRSGALGCPEPGMSYTQALVPGVLILLKAGDEGFGYHASSDRTPFYCPRDRAKPPESMQAEDLA
jgi:hypothetical protein